ncbi:hypothetical protein BD410DRAFT_832348 [Rickenella mellea]|uniref:Signal peptidase complex catalytic subunit SEC11 n=1 Tax=Rickenella mellea TaxID=50990 RepID=A0A4Y7PL52_9AGAM|nr:hypothetical protein BD410DRAFT_832348 [Rickenella mellea]
MFESEIKSLRRLGVRKILLQLLAMGSSLAPMFVLWKGLGLLTNTESPVVVVLSGSMEPAFRRGDILFLTNPPNKPYRNGDITVYNVPGQNIPIFHRVVETHNEIEVQDGDQDGEEPLVKQRILTKGDNNPVDDIGLYRGLEWIERRHVIGKVRGFVPYVGYISIAINEFPRLRLLVFGGTALMALV